LPVKVDTQREPDALKKKVYLLYPPISKKERYSSDVGSVGGEQIPLGIYYLAAYLRQNGYVVYVTDAEALKLTEESIIREIRQIAPNYVGISSTTVAFHRALGIATIIKEIFPNMPVVLGGPHVTSNVEHALSFSAFDYGVIGEGEATALELFNVLANKGLIGEIKGIAYRDNNGNVTINPKREFINDLDMLPFPAYDLIRDIDIYTPPPSNYKTLPVVNIITSRGCPNLCTFCDRNVFGRKYRERSAQNVFEEIKYLHEKYHIREIAFVDDTFLINKKRIHELFDLLNKEGLHFSWTCMARINNVTFEFLQFLGNNGCWNIAFGIESGDESILNVIKKNISIENVRKVIDWCYKLKIKTKGFFIVGHPQETVETINKTIRLACSLKLDAVVVTINTPIPGSQQYAEAHTYGNLDITDWSQFNYWRPVFVPHGLTEEILLKKQKEFYTRFYLRPRIIFNYVKSFFGRGGMRRFKSVIKLFGYLVPGDKR
jgi:anaerobic magnesium-protoporphyrin IX monomethyl ester cyclase